MMDDPISEKVVLVTGATSGIGMAIAKEMGRQGYRVMVHGRTSESSEEAVESLSGESIRAQAVYGDLCIPEDVEKLIASVSERCDALHGLINNAGSLVGQPLRRMSRVHWQSMLDIHLLGPLQLTNGLFGLLRKANGASLVNISSFAAKRPVVGRAAYSAAKAAMVNLTASLANEWAPYQIRANAVLPGSIDTALLRKTLSNQEAVDHIAREIGLKRLGLASEVAQMVAFLMSDRASYCTGGAFPVDGGLH